MAVHWGPELVSIYNDAFIPVYGVKHPAALGRPVKEWWTEVWEKLSEVFDQALQGRATYAVDSPYSVLRDDNDIDECYFTHSHSPLWGDGGRIEGVLAVAFETTGAVRSRAALQATSDRHTALLRMTQLLRDLKNPEDIMQAAAEMVGRHLGVNRSGFAEWTEDRLLRHTITWTDGTLTRVDSDLPEMALGSGMRAGAHEGRVMAVDDVLRDPLTLDSIFPSLGVRSCIAVPIVRRGRWRAGFYVHCGQPRSWNDSEIACVEEVADFAWDAVERARAQVSLRESEARFRTALDIAQLGTFDWDLQADRIIYSERTR